MVNIQVDISSFVVGLKFAICRPTDRVLFGYFIVWFNLKKWEHCLQVFFCILSIGTSFVRVPTYFNHRNIWILEYGWLQIMRVSIQPNRQYCISLAITASRGSARCRSAQTFYHFTYRCNMAPRLVRSHPYDLPCSIRTAVHVCGELIYWMFNSDTIYYASNLFANIYAFI